MTPRDRRKAREDARRAHWRVKLAVLALLGGKCAWCGESDPVVLQVDHVRQAKKGERYRSGAALYRAILAGRRTTDGLQVLCANDNVRKRSSGEELLKHDDLGAG